MTSSTLQLTVQRIIAVLSAVSTISAVVGTRIYGSYLATVQQAQFPAISIHLIDGSRRVDQGGYEVFLMQIDVWMKAEGANPATWDDVATLWADVLEALHAVGGIQSTTLRLLRLTNIGQGPQLYEPDTSVLHLPTRWQVRALV